MVLKKKESGRDIDLSKRYTRLSGNVQKGTGSSRLLSFLRTLTVETHIPTLQEVFALIGNRAGINIELKGAETAAPVVQFIHEQVACGWPYDKILVSSFDHRQLDLVKRLDANIKTGALIVGLPQDNAAFGEKLGAFSVNLSTEFIDQAFVEDAHKRGLKVLVFTVNELDDIARMRALGVDGIITNYLTA